jgi:hypothetical protein
MRRTDSDRPAAAGLAALAARIGPRPVRRLFVRFCHEVVRFSDTFEYETAPFDVSFRDASCGFSVAVSPLRELFLVSIGESRSLDIRVTSAESFMFALDLVLARYLESASRVSPAA